MMEKEKYTVIDLFAGAGNMMNYKWKDINKMLYGIDIFSGAGGLSLGAEMAGTSIMFAVEKDKSAAETYRYNHHDTPVICDDIHNIDPLQHITPIGAGDQLIVFGGPPCQGFSMANRQRLIDDPRNHLYKSYVEIVKRVQPKFFVMENVKGMLSVASQVKEDFNK